MTREESKQNAFMLLQIAHNRAEVDAAQKAHREHLDKWPEDWRCDLAHGFHNTVGLLESREAESKQLGLTSEEHAYREEMFRRIPDTGMIILTIIGPYPSLDKAIAARETRIYDLKKWLQRYPTDSFAQLEIRLLNEDKEREAQFIRDYQEIEYHPEVPDDSFPSPYYPMCIAYSREEIEETQKIDDDYLATLPEDRREEEKKSQWFLRNYFHKAVKDMEGREAEAKRLNLTSEQQAYREEMLRPVPDEYKIFPALVGLLSPVEEVVARREARIVELLQWRERYPTDQDVERRLQQLDRNKQREARWIREQEEWEA